LAAATLDAVEDAKRWKGVPQWKRAVLEQKEAKEAKRNAPALAKAKEEAERKAKIDAMPAWMQALTKG
jgi:hypothetical protein